MTSAPNKLAGIREMAKRNNLHVQLLENIPERKRLPDLLRFWQPFGVIVECGGTKINFDPSDFGSVPIVFFNGNPASLPEVITAARLADIKIPQDISVIGVDNLERICDNTTPTLSSIEPNFRQGGNLAVILLIEVTRAAAPIHTLAPPRRPRCWRRISP